MPSLLGSSTNSKSEVSELLSLWNELDATLDDYVPNGAQTLSNMTAKLFGLPYQFNKYVDPRASSVNKTFGRHFITTFVTDAPLLSVIPGKPKYLKSNSLEKVMLANLSDDESGSSELSSLVSSSDSNSEKRFYDFQQAYTSFYSYVNVLCRSCAIFMEIGDKYMPGTTTKLSRYDWKDYRLDGRTYAEFQSESWNSLSSIATGTLANAFSSVISGGVSAFNAVEAYLEQTGKSVKSIFDAVSNSSKNTDTVDETGSDSTDSGSGDDTSADAEEVEELMSSMRYVQFYIDPAESGVNENITNTTGESKFESVQSSISDLAKEVGFLINSGGASDAAAIQEYVGEGIAGIGEQLASGSGGTLTNLFSTFLTNLGSSLTGESVIFPKIWKSSSFEKSYTIKMKFRAVYGNRLSYYLDVLVPVLHCLAMALPKQTTVNTFGSPFIHRFYYPGVFSCNMGIVQSLQIDKHSSDTSWTIDGFPNEIDVTMQVEDLYSDMSMTSSADAELFVANTSLVNYLGTLCGINYITPTINTKLDLLVNASANEGSGLGANAEFLQQIKNIYSDLADNQLQKLSIM
jgi:hypothetical protein